MDNISDKLFLHESHWEIMLADILERNFEEACGLVAGVDQTSCAVFRVINVLHSPVRFRMDPEQQLGYFNQIDNADWQLQAIYHSHLKGPEQPSPIDIAEANYPGVINLIWSDTSGHWDCRGYLITKGIVERIPIYRIEAK
jgi:proteasome lid subunit RPN8/RPN11